MATEIILPEMGEGVIEGLLSRWLVKVGDRVEKYAPIAEVETDKVTAETIAEESGTILELCVPEGETVPVGTVLAYIGQPGEQLSVSSKQSSVNGEQLSVSSKQSSVNGEPAVSQSPISNPQSPIPNPQSPYNGRISPVVGRMAAEHRINLDLVLGTGRNGRITKRDILAYLETQKATEIEIEPTIPHPVTLSPPHPITPAPPPLRSPATDEILPLSGMRRSIAEHMVRSKHTSPHVTTVFEFDFTAVAAHRAVNKAAFARDGANLTYMAYIVAATVQALKQHSLVNSEWSDAGIVLKRAINIGMATAVADGLLVPVIKNADTLNLLGLAKTINDLANRARNKKVQLAELQGGSFSISNHGTSGSLFATPIINQPQCGILGVGKIEKRVKVINDAIGIRPLAYASFTFDHRILDGATADAFVNTIKEIMENWK